MYITDKYWGEYIGGSDDSMTLVAYLARRRDEDVSLGEIFSDFGLDRLGGEFRRPETPLVYDDPYGWEMEIHYAISLISDLAALLLECRTGGPVDLHLLDEADVEEPTCIRLRAAEEENALIDQTLRDFASHPEEYDISEMLSAEELREMAAVCGELRKELYG